eukprot:CAMPEP_0170061660 /NCGR_PEP_ID=MMETSP0019_2-20121128/3152_1 /TAXON_ID=98059 /ORGANISM="Dinobryon sp., Strain UTEXLB2267" /LENGTH=460 /DNA_ID=CAMNT_0010267561 /DNA_START=498 /DNA_END=1879 /DNA_ORIENTATION=+
MSLTHVLKLRCVRSGAGPPLYANLCRYLHSQPLEEWVPQSEFLGLIGTGDGWAVASKGGLGVEGAHLWQLKDHIDRQWMAGYQNLPSMEDMLRRSSSGGSGEREQSLAASMGADTIALLSKAQMRCGGCGSKVGQQVLTRALKQVQSFVRCNRPEVLSAGDDAAVIRPPPPPYLLVQSIDYFRSFVSDPFLFGQIAANHALSDLYAMNGEAVSALALCVLPFGPENKVEQTLIHILAGALCQLGRENCALVGGHTSEGAELAMGLSVTGAVHPDKVLRKGTELMSFASGPRAGADKPLGTGTVMAADMRYSAKGNWLAACLRSMLQSNASAARVLSSVCSAGDGNKDGMLCSGCTDVTGFGLLGHLLEMIQCSEDDTSRLEADSKSGLSSKCSVELILNDIPLLPGAAECVKNGILSSLQPQNIRCARAIGNATAGNGHATYPLLFDPQTSGGLLAAVAP